MRHMGGLTDLADGFFLEGESRQGRGQGNENGTGQGLHHDGGAGHLLDGDRVIHFRLFEKDIHGVNISDSHADPAGGPQANHRNPRLGCRQRGQDEADGQKTAQGQDPHPDAGPQPIDPGRRRRLQSAKQAHDGPSQAAGKLDPSQLGVIRMEKVVGGQSHQLVRRKI